MILVDGGYLSWIYGTRPNFGSWDSVRYDFIGRVIFMDHWESQRTQLNPAYKSRRREKELNKPELIARRKRVKEFQELIINDPLLTVYSHEGCEADDLVALAYLLNSGEVKSVIGIDKDYLQVPGLRNILTDFKGEPINWAQRLERSLPKKAILPGLVEPQPFLKTQVLMGDKTDSVPRLLPLRDFELYRWLHEEESWRRILTYFGYERVWNSLQMLLMPGIFLSKLYPTITSRSVLPYLETGLYWDPASFRTIPFLKDLRQHVKAKSSPSRTSQLPRQKGRQEAQKSSSREISLDSLKSWTAGNLRQIRERLLEDLQHSEGAPRSD